MLDEHGSRTAAGDLEAVAGGLRGGILIGGADELCDEVFDGREKLEKAVLAWNRQRVTVGRDRDMRHVIDKRRNLFDDFRNARLYLVGFLSSLYGCLSVCSLSRLQGWHRICVVGHWVVFNDLDGGRWAS